MPDLTHTSCCVNYALITVIASFHCILWYLYSLMPCSVRSQSVRFYICKNSSMCSWAILVLLHVVKYNSQVFHQLLSRVNLFDSPNGVHAQWCHCTKLSSYAIGAICVSTAPLQPYRCMVTSNGPQIGPSSVVPC